MAAIPAEARARFLSELPDMLATIDEINGVNAALDGLATVNVQTPIWVDDDKGTRTLSLTAEGTDLSLTVTDKIKGRPA